MPAHALIACTRRLARRGGLVTCAAAVLTFAAPAHANIYKCVDSQGREWIRDHQPRGEKCRLSMAFGPATPKGDAGGHKAAKGTRRSTFKPPRVGEPLAPTQEPESLKERMALYEGYIQEASERYQVPDAFIKAVIRVESSYRYRAESGAGAQGLMQLMPGTAREMGVHDAFDPRQNILGGARLLRLLANRYDGDMVKVLAAYNAGAGALAKKGGIPFEGTEGYVRSVLDHYYRYKAGAP